MNLEAMWREISSSNQDASGKPVAMWHGGLLLASIGATGKPSFIVQIKDELESLIENLSPIRTFGFNVEYKRLVVGSNETLCAVLEARDSADLTMFIAICEHLISELKAPVERKPAAQLVDQIIRTWLAYWRTLKENFSPAAFAGLVGELLAIDRWLDMSSFKSSNWEGPRGGPHDFCGDAKDIEVKVSSTRSGPLAHGISSLDQLQERPQRSLGLLSFRLGFAETGVESTHDLVTRISKLDTFQTDSGKDLFNSAVAMGGYSADIPKTYSHFDIWAEALFQVRDGFPRITRKDSQLNSRIADVRYVIDLSGLENFIDESDRPIDLNT